MAVGTNPEPIGVVFRYAGQQMKKLGVRNIIIGQACASSVGFGHTIPRGKRSASVFQERLIISSACERHSDHQGRGRPVRGAFLIKLG
jgi:hypothetical protein